MKSPVTQPGWQYVASCGLSTIWNSPEGAVYVRGNRITPGGAIHVRGDRRPTFEGEACIAGTGVYRVIEGRWERVAD